MHSRGGHDVLLTVRRQLRNDRRDRQLRARPKRDVRKLHVAADLRRQHERDAERVRVLRAERRGLLREPGQELRIGERHRQLRSAAHEHRLWDLLVAADLRWQRLDQRVRLHVANGRGLLLEQERDLRNGHGRGQLRRGPHGIVRNVRVAADLRRQRSGEHLRVHAGEQRRVLRQQGRQLRDDLGHR